MFILTQQQPQAEMCSNKEPETAFLPKDLSIAEGTIYISFLEVCAPLSDNRVEEVFCVHKATVCACLDWREEALKLPQTVYRNQHIGAGGLHREHSPLTLPPWHKK